MVRYISVICRFDKCASTIKFKTATWIWWFNMSWLTVIIEPLYTVFRMALVCLLTLQDRPSLMIDHNGTMWSLWTAFCCQRGPPSPMKKTRLHPRIFNSFCSVQELFSFRLISGNIAFLWNEIENLRLLVATRHSVRRYWCVANALETSWNIVRSRCCMLCGEGQHPAAWFPLGHMSVSVRLPPGFHT